MLIAKFVNSEAGWNSDIAKAKTLLTLGCDYQVTDIDMGGYHTDIWLAGFVEPFNSVQFDFYEDGIKIDIYSSKKYNPYL